MRKIIFITGTDTGAGKTILIGLLLAHLRAKGVHALALKPFCAGSRSDAKLLFELQEREISLDVVNPFYFKEPLAPLVAARRTRQSISLDQALERIRTVQNRCEVLLVEGAGGLLVPLGERFVVADLITRLECAVIVAARNKLGVINHALLTLCALRNISVTTVQIVLMGIAHPDLSFFSNEKIIQEYAAPWKISALPFLSGNLAEPGVIRNHSRKRKKLLARLANIAIFHHTFSGDAEGKLVGDG